MYDFTLIAVVAFVSFIFFTIIFLASRYKRCPSNKVLAVYGKLRGNKSVKCYHGGGTFIWPLIQDYEYLSLTPMTINIPLKGALSHQNIRINVPSTFTIAIDTTPETMNNAAIRLLGLNQRDMENMAHEIIVGQLRLTVASLTIEQINQDREKFLEAIRNNVDTELRKIGLVLINVNVTDITDESGYIMSIGKKAAAIAINQAKIDVADQEKKGEVGRALAEQEQRISVALYESQAVEGENNSQANIEQFNADLAERTADAQRRSEIAQQKAIMEIQIAKAHAELKRLEAQEIVPKEIAKRSIEIDASAAAEKRIREAHGEAQAIIAVKQAEAIGIKEVLNAKAQGYKQIVESCGNNTKDAATMLLVEKLHEIVKLQSDAIKNIKIDKITVWDSGDGQKGSSTANFMSSMVKSLPALHDVAGMAGIDLPSFLGSVTEQKKESYQAASKDAAQDGAPKAHAEKHAHSEKSQ